MIQVVVVDDDFRIAKAHSMAVKKVSGFSVAATTNTIAAATAAVRRHRPDLLLLDLYLPDGWGLDLLRQLRADDVAIDVIVLTASDDMAHVRDALRLGALQYLIKPFPLSRLHRHLIEYQRLQRYMGWSPASQNLVDRMFQLTRTPDEAGQSPGGNPTLDSVLQTLPDGADWIGATAIADKVGISLSTARRYLSRLVALGRVELSLQYGAAGRPTHLYRRACPAGRVA